MANYKEKLAHPEWQKKRLEVFQRDNFTCTLCDSKDKELHVHHVYYLQNARPQDYPLKALVTLCFECHAYEEECLRNVAASLMGEFREMGGCALEIDRFTWSLKRYLQITGKTLWSMADEFESATTPKTEFKESDGLPF